MRSCASCPCKSRLKPVKEPDLRLLLPLVTEEDMSESVLRLPKKSRLPLRELLLMPNLTLSQLEEDIGAQELVTFIQFLLKSRESVDLVQ